MKFDDHNLKVSFKEYKDIDAINYSLLKSIDYFGSSALHLKDREEKESDALLKGKLTEDLVFEPDSIDDKYIVQLNMMKVPTALSLILANELISNLREKGIYNADRNHEDTRSLILSICKEKNLWFKQSEEVIMSKFDDSFWDYVTMMASKRDKSIVGRDIWEKCNTLANILKNHKFTKDILSRVISDDIEVINQFCYVFNLNINGKSCKIKILVDLVIIDHQEKTVELYDLKTGSPRSIDFVDNFYKYKYYLQGGLYYIGISHLIDKHFKGYKIKDDKLSFVYISTQEYDPYPIVWEMNSMWIENAWSGFTNGNTKHNGLLTLLEDYIFYSNSNTNERREVLENNGVLEIPLFKNY